MSPSAFACMLDLERNLAQCDKPKSWASLIIEHVLQGAEGISDEQQQQIQVLFAQVQAGKHVAHVLGYNYFYGRKFLVTKDVLIPRDDTEVIVQEVIASGASTIVDWCTGTGCIGISCALEMPNSQVSLLDISAPACAVAEKNVRAFDLDNRVQVLQADCRQSWPVGQVACVVANPPYIASMDEHLPGLCEQEPRLALDGGVSGLDFIAVFLEKTARHLQQDGLLVMECGYDQQASVEAMVDSQVWYDYRALYDLADRFRGFRIRKA